ncbi:manganese efflux pump MntP family protein [Poseidonibacter lekithochrous]|uniref:manganese efflux pump MntP n=1 Tax=Poseidonibacter TaxID=2321187 RepID=UPI001C08D137|nr:MULTISPECIES: manganese efflux pump MntP family protein [Poseidonibacter]MBU3013292.1 manganese efflux pump MntP family protein [Poseidonibacter lekithochrous]MDO6826589.1 manganese efflux pump MntP family protein [Poseidonibacter sp. 1_MG-2023]
MELFLIAIALAMDSVAVSIASGSKYKDTNFFIILKIALFFGVFQGIMPLFGYLLGNTFSSFVDTIDHYIAFIILIYLGFKMIKEARNSNFEDEVKDLKNKTLVLLAIATSIDALAIGITFSFSSVDILYAVSLITVITFILCFIAVYIGRFLGGFLEDKAEYLGGIILIILGFKILIEGI